MLHVCKYLGVASSHTLAKAWVGPLGIGLVKALFRAAPFFDPEKAQREKPELKTCEEKESNGWGCAYKLNLVVQTPGCELS